jgi:membrane protease YdiL (CAAX protease family)
VTEAVAASSETDTAPPRDHYGLEVLAVLLVSLGMSGIYALLYFIRAEVTVQGGIGATTTSPIASGAASAHVLLDFLDDLADVLNGLAPAFLAIVLLLRSPAGRGLGVGLDLSRWRREIAQGAGFTALIGIPGLGLIYLARQLNLNANLDVVDFPDVWYRVPMLLLDAAQNGILEEIVVVAFMLTRLRQLGWSDSRALGASALLRGSYHLYQGLGGFFGNMVMGVIFGWWFQRTRRVVPLATAHFLLDAVSFVGYTYLHGHLSWV